MKRKYPVSYFLLGVLQNFIRYFLFGLIGFVLLLIGALGVHICKIIGTVVLACYLLLCIIEQLFIRSACLKESENLDFNDFMDAAFCDKHDENALSSHERIMKFVEDKIKSEDKNMDK